MGTGEAEWLSLIRERILQNLNNEQLSVGFLAVYCGISERQFARKIKTLTGLSPGNFIQAIRLERALYLLEKRIYPTVSEVSHAVGCKNPGYFSKIFQARYGKPPKAYLMITPKGP